MSDTNDAGSDENNEINLTPMLDVVFIMLIFFEVDLGHIEFQIKRLHAQSPGGGIVVQADAAASAKYTLAVIDAAKAAGIEPIVLATTSEH